MTREELEHVIRASADITGQYEFIVVGSQSILGAVPNPAAVFTMSAGADIYRPEKQNFPHCETPPDIQWPRG